MNELYVMRQAIYELTQMCEDIEFLDLIYKMLILECRWDAPPAPAAAEVVQLFPALEVAA